MCEIACGGLRDDAELFGSNLGGMGGKRRSEGKLVTFLRDCQERKARNIVFLDEFEKIQGLTSALGWDQAKKMYQGFLEPWQEGTLSDASNNSNPKISCKDTIFICTTNLGQQEIITFCERHSQRLQHESKQEEDWLQRKLVTDILVGRDAKRGVLRQFFYGVHPTLEALVRRISKVVPFLPLTPKEALIVADSELRKFLGPLRKPPIAQQKLMGNLIVWYNQRVCEILAMEYNVMLGASSLQQRCESIKERLVSGWLNQSRFSQARTKRYGTAAKGTDKKLLWLVTAKRRQDVEQKDDTTIEIVFEDPGPETAPPDLPPALPASTAQDSEVLEPPSEDLQNYIADLPF